MPLVLNREAYGCAAVGTLSVMIVLVASARAFVVFQIATMTNVSMSRNRAHLSTFR